MRTRGIVATVWLSVLVFPSVLIAATYYVPADHSTIQEAINASVSGDTIIVSPGTYTENIHFNGKNVVLTSTDLNNPQSTVIDGNRNGSVVTFSGSETPACELRGFTITKGYGYDNGGGINGQGTLATIAACTITGNYAGHYWGCMAYALDGRGGGIHNCDGMIINCTIVDNKIDTPWEPPGLLNGGDARGGGLYECDGMIINCTIAHNRAWTGSGLYGCNGLIANCIIWDNNVRDSSMPGYSCIQGWTGAGTGNISSDPLFADPNNGDYHLKSKNGRWLPGKEYTYLDPNDTPADPNDDFWVIVPAGPSQWVYDPNTSPCIDTGGIFDGTPGDPNDWRGELWPHGKRINMGAYGGTPQASMSPNHVGNIADLDHDDEVDVLDLELLSKDWLYNKYLLDTDLNRDGIVDIADFAEFGQQWLWVEP